MVNSTGFATIMPPTFLTFLKMPRSVVRNQSHSAFLAEAKCKASFGFSRPGQAGAKVLTGRRSRGDTPCQPVRRMHLGASAVSKEHPASPQSSPRPMRGRKLNNATRIRLPCQFKVLCSGFWLMSHQTPITKGLNIDTPVPAMSSTFLVTNVMWLASAVAAISESIAGRFRPARSATPQISPQSRATSPSTGSIRLPYDETMMSFNQCSSSFARASPPRLTMPIRTSPIVNQER